MRLGNGGQSFIQILVGMGLLAVMAFSMMEMNAHSLKSQNNNRLLNEFNNLTNLTGLAIQGTGVCNSNLNTTNLGSLTFDTDPTKLSTQAIDINKLT